MEFNGHKAQKRGLKQQNKAHKTGKHRSKGKVSELLQGRVETNVRRVLKGGVGHAVERRKERVNHSNQLRKAKRAANFLSKRVGASAPHVIVVIGLCDGATNPTEVAKMLVPPESAVTIDGPYATFQPPALKRKILLAAASLTDINAAMHLASAADTVMFALSAGAPVSEFGELCVQCLRTQGTASVAHVLLGLDSIAPKRRGDAKKMMTKTAESQFPKTKVHVLSEPKDAGGILWNAANQKRSDVRWRQCRPYMLAHQIDFVPASSPAAAAVPDGTGTMVVRAYVRGRPMDVNRLVYLPGGGAYQLEKIVVGDVAGIHGRAVTSTAEGMSSENAEARTLVPDPEMQESLQQVAEVDPFEGEQHWPTDEEIAAAQAATAAQFGNSDTMIKVPKGTSSYQASWIADEASSADEGEEDESSTNMEVADEDEGAVEDDFAEPIEGAGPGTVRWADQAEGVDDDGTELVTLDGRGEGDAAKYDQMVDEEEDDGDKYLRAAEDEVWPDEVDTPQDKLAKIRFQKYRGLASFRHSPWDNKEELPDEYARIFQFQSFRQTANRVLKSSQRDCDDEFAVEAGQFVTLYIAGVDATLASRWQTIGPDQPLNIFGLLPHENRMSMLNFKLSMAKGFTEPIKSKERLIFSTGVRQFSCCPVFSQHSTGDKHKFERFFRPGSTVIASTFGPIHFPPMPVLVFRPAASGGLQLVASGNLMTVDPERVVVKRIRLSAHVYKVNKRTAVLRYMFWGPEDIHWFKPVELTTAYGRRGHIKMSLGTHGHMKATFDKPITYQDTIFMSLYKRIYPKWTYRELPAQ